MFDHRRASPTGWQAVRLNGALECYIVPCEAGANVNVAIGFQKLVRGAIGEVPIISVVCAHGIIVDLQNQMGGIGLIGDKFGSKIGESPGSTSDVHIVGGVPIHVANPVLGRVNFDRDLGITWNGRTEDCAEGQGCYDTILDGGFHNLNRSVCDWVTQVNLSRCGGLAGYYHGRSIFGIVDHALCFLWLFIATTAFVVVQTITRFAGCQQYIHTFFITPIHRHISYADLQPGNSATWCGVLIKKSPNAIALKIPGRNSATSELSPQEPTFSGGNASSYHPAHAHILGKVGGDASSAVRVGDVPSRFLPAIRESAPRPTSIRGDILVDR